jgi:ankyrin repeat protein
MSRCLHPNPTAACLTLVALFVGLYYCSKPPAAREQPNALSKVLEAADVPAARFLLEAGANLTQKDICDTPLHKASILGNVSAVRSLLDDGAATEAVDSCGQTPLFAAAALGRDEVAQALLARGANARVVDRRGRTPLHWAVASGCEEMAAILTDYGADPDAQDADGVTPRGLANADFPAIARYFNRTNPPPASQAQ